uniref:Tektin n=1 Tax=Angiostrongylus cantonensis TaxID=6313 RepID=A0A0K0CT54_ANGCA
MYLRQVVFLLGWYGAVKIGLNEKLEQTWGRLCRALSENEAKLNVTEAFNTTIVEVNHRIDELGHKVKELRDSRLIPEKICAMERRRLANDIQELRHIADMLIAQVNANHNATAEIRQAATASIRSKVDGVEAAHRQMDSLFIENVEPARSQSLYKLNEQSSISPEENSRSYYHVTNISRRPSSGSNIAAHSALNPMNDNRSWRSHEFVREINLGSIRLSDTESYL